MLMLIIAVSKSLVDSQNKGTLDYNFRSTTTALSPAISAADFVYVFNVPSNSTTPPTVLTSASPIATTGNQTGANYVGDLLVAVYYNYPGYVNASGVTSTAVYRIVGVCRLYNSATGKYPIYMFDSAVRTWNEFSPTAQTQAANVASVVALLPTVAEVMGGKMLVDSALPTASGVNPSTGENVGNGIFLYNGNGTGAVMLALLSSGLTGQQVSNAYTYSISSRNL